MTQVLVVTDSDSYVKYGAALVDQLPSTWRARLVIAKGNAEPSARQVEAALVGTRFEGTRPERVGLADVDAVLRCWRPDVVVLAARGHTVQTVVGIVENLPRRPVLVSGLAGIGVPVLSYGLGFRRSIDLFLVHSHHEVAAFREASRASGFRHEFALATLPFLRHPERADTGQPRDAIVFAAQAMVPSTRRERAWLVGRLVETARRNPQLRLVVKTRAEAGELQTHAEHVGFADLLAAHDVPDNLVVEGGPMREHLQRAVGFVTVSSTALLEAVDEGVPALVLTDFGVGPGQINEVFRGSGLLGTTDDLVAARFRRADPGWLDENYFHAPEDDDWVGRLEELLAQRETEGLPPYEPPPESAVHRVRMRLYRNVAFTPADAVSRALTRHLFLVLARSSRVVRWWGLRRRGGRGQVSGAAGAGRPALGPRDVPHGDDLRTR